MKRLIFATRNKDKLREMKDLFSGLSFDIRSVLDYPEIDNIVEDGETLKENASQKACHVHKLTGEWALADDTGLFIDALDGRPGVYSSRYSRQGASYEENWEKVLLEMSGVPKGKRNARFVCCLALVGSEGVETFVEESLEGEITDEPKGRRGFGYDPIFLIPSLGKTLAELTLDEKNKMSHRAKAFLKIRNLLEKLMSQLPIMIM